MSISLVPPRRLSSRETIVYKGNAINLQCPVDSYPAAKIRWIKPGNTFSNGDVSVVNNTLNIKHVKQEHEGIYLCEGKNMFGSTFTAVFVKVRSESKRCRLLLVENKQKRKYMWMQHLIKHWFILNLLHKLWTSFGNNITRYFKFQIQLFLSRSSWTDIQRKTSNLKRRISAPKSYS